MGDHGKACVPELEERNCNIVLVSMWPCLGALRDAFVLPPYLVPQVSQHHPIRSQVDLVYHADLTEKTTHRTEHFEGLRLCSDASPQVRQDPGLCVYWRTI